MMKLFELIIILVLVTGVQRASALTIIDGRVDWESGPLNGQVTFWTLRFDKALLPTVPPPNADPSDIFWTLLTNGDAPDYGHYGTIHGDPAILAGELFLSSYISVELHGVINGTWEFVGDEEDGYYRLVSGIIEYPGIRFVDAVWQSENGASFSVSSEMGWGRYFPANGGEESMGNMRWNVIEVPTSVPDGGVGLFWMASTVSGLFVYARGHQLHASKAAGRSSRGRSQKCQ